MLYANQFSNLSISVKRNLNDDFQHKKQQDHAITIRTYLKQDQNAQIIFINGEKLLLRYFQLRKSNFNFNGDFAVKVSEISFLKLRVK